ncbi:hypothetical protein [Nocardia wallacei]|uniref:hypothetical protein n=1 Tax=Nocardia wallacei TaxID=480035 RepID=UPI0024575019|nr:hypothetical protein [Nocardia wallacei]
MAIGQILIAGPMTVSSWCGGTAAIRVVGLNGPEIVWSLFGGVVIISPNAPSEPRGLWSLCDRTAATEPVTLGMGVGL